MVLDKRITVKQTRKGKVYGFHAYIGTNPETGKSVTVTRSGFKTGTAAQNALKKLISEGPKERFNSKMTVDELFAEWFNHYFPGVRESTAYVTKVRYKSRIKKELGNSRVTALTTARLQGFIDDLAQDNLKMIRRHRAILIDMLDYAKVLHIIKENPATDTILPKIKREIKTKNNYYEKEELQIFLETAKTQPIYQYLFFTLLAYTGVRKGEALALKWDDIDFENETISINKNVGKTIDNLQIITPPKNQSSIREIPINSHLLKILKAEKTLSVSEWVFYNYKDQKIFSVSTPHVWLKSIYAKLPDDFLHINVHGFRHTFATMYVEKNPNSNPKELQRILGHTKITTTLDIYTHVTNLGKENMKKGIDNLDFRPKEKTAEITAEKKQKS